MNIAVIGAGAIGGWIAARLSLAGEKVSAIARGPTRELLREQGLLLTEGGETRIARLAVSAALPPQDLIIIAVKAPRCGTRRWWQRR